MKKTVILFLFAFVSVTGQKLDRTNFGAIQNIKTTDYAVTFTVNYSKIGGTRDNSKMVFINTKTEKITEVNLSKKVNIRKVTTDIDVNFQDSKFVLVECYSGVEKRLPKASNSVNELYLISLNDFKLIKITSDNFTLINWEFNDKTNKILFIEQENGMKDLSGEVQRIIAFDLENGTKKEVFSNN